MQISGIGPAVDGVAETYCPRRTVLDTLLAGAAEEAGAELIDGFVVGDMLWSEGRAVGVRGHHRTSPGSSLRARIVVGADGLHSTVARRVAARAYREYPPLTAVYYSYWSGIHHLGASFHARPGRLILVWPTNDDLTCIYVAWPRQDFGHVRKDAETHFHSALDLVPGLRDTVASGRAKPASPAPATCPTCTGRRPGRDGRSPATPATTKTPRPAWACQTPSRPPNCWPKPSTTAWPGTGRMDQAVSGYQHRRDALTGSGFDLALTTARLAPLTPRLEAFYRAAAQQPELGRQIFGVLGGSLTAADVYPDRHTETADARDTLTPSAPR